MEDSWDFVEPQTLNASRKKQKSIHIYDNDCGPKKKTTWIILGGGRNLKRSCRARGKTSLFDPNNHIKSERSVIRRRLVYFAFGSKKKIDTLNLAF